MSLSGVVSFALLFKKIVRKGSIAKRFKSKKETHGQTQTQNSEEDPPFDSFNLCREKKPNQGKSTHVLYGQQEKPILPQTSSDTLVPRLSLYTKNRLSELPSLSPADQNDISPFRCASDNNANVNVNVNANVNMVNTPTNLDKDSNEDPAGQVSQSLSPVARDKIPELVINELDNSSNQVYNPLSDTIVAETPEIMVRDFGFPTTSPLHYGQSEKNRRESRISMISTRFTGCYARALYDFSPETEHEAGMKKGEVVWIQYKQCRGWLVADVRDGSGLIPESYVEFV